MGFVRARHIWNRKYKQKREGAQNKGHTRRNVGRAAKTKHKRDECILDFCLNIQCRTMHILRLYIGIGRATSTISPSGIAELAYQ